MVSMRLTPPPAPASFTVRRERRPIIYSSSTTTMRPIRQSFRVKPIVPSPRQWRREARVCLPEGLILAHRPLSTNRARPMWPCGHTTKRPRLSYTSQTPKECFCPTLEATYRPRMASVNRKYFPTILNRC